MDNIEKNIIYEQSIEDLIPQQHTSATKYTLAVICIFLVGLIVFSCVLPYPTKVSGNAEIVHNNGKYYAFLYLSPERTGEIKKGMNANIYTMNYPESTYGHLNGKVMSFVKNVSAMEDGKLYVVKIYLGEELVTNYGCQLSNQLKIIGTGDIIVKEQFLIESFFEPINKIIHYQ